MATTPQKPPQPEPTHRPHPSPQGKPSTTIQTDQLVRSQEMEEMGMDNWIRAHDERDPNAKPKQVPGVAPVYGGDQPGTPDTPPEGHDDVQPGPGEPGGPTAGHYVDATAPKARDERRAS
jgi:hypothetical protein